MIRKRWLQIAVVVTLLVGLFPALFNAPEPVLAAGEAVRGELNGWGTWGMSDSLGGTFIYLTGQVSDADDSNSEFKFFKDTDQWYSHGSAITYAQIFSGMNTDTGPNMSFNHTQNSHYVFKWNGSDAGVIFQLSSAPSTITNVNRSPSAPTNSDTVTVNVTLNSAMPTEQATWLRYTTDGWSTSTVVKMTGSGTTYSAQIPAQSDGTTVEYYVFISGDVASIAGNDADLMTIAYDTNSGSNYTYTIGNPITDAQALWLDADTIAWNGTTGSSYKLLYDLDGAVDAAVAGATACSFPSPSDPCYVNLTASGTVSGYDKNPNATGLTQLTTSLSDANAKHLLKGQVVVASYDSGGDLLDISRVQIQSVLDALYATAAEAATLGVTYTQGITPTVHLWAPTAKSVDLLRFETSTSTVTNTHPMTVDTTSGVWSVTGEPGWDRDFYLFDVEVYVPSEDAVLNNLVTDPYAVSLSIDSARSQFVNLDDADLKPTDWDSFTKPTLDAFEDISIYEMHIRDFSINDSTVITPEHRGTYAAFTYDGARRPLSDGMAHLLALEDAGLTHVHLLPTFDIASVPEDVITRTVWPSPTGYARDSETPQSIVSDTRAIDGFNWGYDPYHYGVPEGSYSTDPDGVQRILEFRQMVQALNENGLRVVMDVVYNHTSASGQYEKSVLDKIVPGYYYRYDTDGVLQQSSCCPDTACEYEMMEKLMIDTLVRFATAYKVDGFRFDLMNLHTRRNMLNVQSELNAVDPDIYLYGEGWDFGSARDKGLTDCTDGWCYAQKYNMTGTGIGLFNDIIRDAAHGGYSQDTVGIRKQGFINGLSYDWNGYEYSNRTQSDLHTVMDTLRSAVRGSGADWNGQGAPFTDDPQESVPYVEKHDNETLFDQNVFKLPNGDGTSNDGWIGTSIPTTTMADRVRAQNMGQSLMALSQGVPFFQMGSDILRSKSLDRNSYDSGDWFNRVYWDDSENNFGKGVPPAWDNESRWSIMKPLLADTSLDPTTADIEFAAAHFRELLRLRYSSPLFRLRTEADVNARTSYYNSDNQRDGLLALHLSDEETSDLDPNYENMLVFFNANKMQQSIVIDGANGFVLHPLHLDGVDDDPVVQSATFNDETDTFTIPARTTAVFVSTEAMTPPAEPSTLDWVGLMYPRGGVANRIDQGGATGDFNVYIQVYEEDVTENGGQGADIDCYLHWGAYGESWTDLPMTYNTDVGNNDEYVGTLTQSTLNSLQPGTYGFTAYCHKTDETGKLWKQDSYDIGGDTSDDDQGDGLITIIPSADPAPAPPGGVFVHLFEWPWADVEKECAFLAEKGYSAVQISPPQEHVVPTADMNDVTTNDFPWWVRYQPVTHLTTTLTSRSGTWTDFTSMVSTCNSLGVDIYADAVINHTADIEIGTPPQGTANTEYTSAPSDQRFYGAQYQSDDFHPDCIIEDYKDRHQVQRCQLSSLPDLETSKSDVQSELHAYLQALLDAGVKGFRIDGAKHMAAHDAAAILDGLTLPGGGTPYIFQEVIDIDTTERVRDWESSPHGDVTEFEYSVTAMGGKFNCGGYLSDLEDISSYTNMMPGDFAVVFTDNHDNQRGHGPGGACIVDHRDGEVHLLANVFTLAYPYGYPKVMSSYYWTTDPGSQDGDSLGPPSTDDGGTTWGVGLGAETRPVYGSGQTAGDEPANCSANYPDDVLNSNNLGQWVCEHRHNAIANMVQFRQATYGEAVSNWQNVGGASSNHIAFGRGDKGFVAINRTGSGATTTYATGMPEGDYCDVVSGERTVDGSACTGATVTVDDSGQIVDYTLSAMDAFAIHAESRLGTPQLSASQDFNLAMDASGLVTATLQTHDGLVVPNRTITFTLVSGEGSLGGSVVTATTSSDGVAGVTYTAPNTVTTAIVSAAYAAADGTDHEDLTAVYVGYRAQVDQLVARRMPSGETSLDLGNTLTVTKQGSGTPLITLAIFDGNPQSSQPGGSEKSDFVDIHLPDATGMTSLLVEVACSPSCDSSDTVWWGNPVTGAWQAVTDASVAFAGDHVTLTLTDSSTPSLTQLSGTPFVVSHNTPTVIALHGFQAESSMSALLMLALVVTAIGTISATALHRRRRS